MFPELAQATATSSAKKPVIPYSLRLVAVITFQREACTAHTGDIWLRCRIIRVKRGIESSTLHLETARAAAVTCSDKNSLSLSSGLLEELIFLIHFLLTHVRFAIAPTDTDD